VGAILRASLELPRLLHNYFYAEFSIPNDPPTRRPQRSGTHSKYMSQLHHTDPMARILSFSIEIADQTEIHAGIDSDHLLFVDQQEIYKTLKRISLPGQDGHGHTTMAWVDWGPPTSRWIPGMRLEGWQRCSHGYRHASLIWDESQSRTILRVLDFNPINTRFRLHRAEQIEEDALVSRRIVTEPTFILAEPFFQEEVTSMLPYQEARSLAPLDLHELSIILIDDRRVITVQVSHACYWSSSW
jgi:hypothetical protein